MDCAITLRHDASADEILTEPTEEQLVSFRKYISVLRQADYRFSEEMAKVTKRSNRYRCVLCCCVVLLSPHPKLFHFHVSRFPALFISLQKEIETEFMEQRRDATAAGTGLITPNDLAFNISLAR